MKIKSGFAKREIAGSVVVVPVGKNAYDFNGMITLNESGGFFWECFVSDTTVEDAVKKVCSEYDVSPQQARQDIEDFLKILKDNDLLE